MLDIVTRARVSKRDLYALFNNKHAVLAAGISERAQRMRRPLDTTTPVPQTPDALATLRPCRFKRIDRHFAKANEPGGINSSCKLGKRKEAAG